MELSDRELLDRFAAGRDDAAFRLLVERYLPVVHGVARRVTGNDDLARDVAQNTFLRLAQRAALVPRDLTLTAWLHRITHHLAIDLVRSEERRKKRELAAHHSSDMDAPSPPDWSALAPVVDTLINRLPAADRDVLLLRYYRNAPHAVVAQQLGLTEAVAKKRAVRALEKLRALLSKQGIATSSAVLATLLPAHAATPVPAPLVLVVSATAKGVAPLAPQGFNLHLAMTTAQKTLIAGAAVLFMASLGYAVRGSSPEAGAPALLSASARGGSDPAASRTRPGRGSPLSAAERLERLRRILALTSRVEKPRQMLAFIDELSPKQFGETAAQLQQLKVSVNSDHFRMLLATWAKIEPQAAVAWAQLAAPESGLPLVLQNWGGIDPEAALDWVNRNTPQIDWQDRSKLSPLISVLAGIAENDPAAAVKALQDIPGENDRAEATVTLAATLGRGGLDRLLEAVPKDAGLQRGKLVAWSASSLMSSDQARRGLELLAADEVAQKQLNIESYFGMWHTFKNEESLAEIPNLPPGKVQDQAVAGICMAAVNGNPPKFFALLRQYPDAATDTVVARMADNCAIEHVGLAAEQILMMQDQALREEALTRRLGWWLSRNESAAREWMESRELPDSVREALKTSTTDTAKP